MANFERFSVWLVPFPFTDASTHKRRPAVVVSSKAPFNAPSGHCVMAMITSSTHAHWPLDTMIADLKAAGLPAPSLVRLKLFTIDQRLVLRQLGGLSPKDQKNLEQNLNQLLS